MCNGQDIETAIKANAKDTEKKDGVMNNEDKASFKELFRFASYSDIFILCIGIFFCIAMSATMPAINLVFGDLIDGAASPVSTADVMRTALIGMASLGVYGFVTFFIGFSMCGLAAARIANGFRNNFMEAVLKQDAIFFDHTEPGSLNTVLSDAAFDVQNGLSDKFAAMLQGIFTFVFGFGIAFYYGPLLSLVLLACTPVLVGIMTLLITWGSEDGQYGKEAYENAAAISIEALSNVRTVFSLNAETQISRRYDNLLGDSESAAVRQGKKMAFLTGSLFAAMFCMEGLGFWYGAKLIADSTDVAIFTHPAPDEFLAGTSPFSPIQQGLTEIFCSSFLDENGASTEAYEVCGCSIPWESQDLPSPNCGCSFSDGSNSGPTFTINDGCFTGGKTIMVFFSILLAAFTAGQIGPGLSALNDGRIAARKMIKVIERFPEIDATKVKGKVRLNQDQIKGELRLDRVQFRYQPKDEDDEGRLIFGGCDLTIQSGETVALVGESGCGKSTIAKLVQRFYDPSEGRILLDGVDLKDIAVADLRANIGVVSQEPLLFDKSIKENIRYGKPNASDEEIMQAAKNANAHKFISQFTDGYDTMVGPRGSRLSGGQKQRVAIARAILRNPPILILDEATSALDNKSEKIVQQALDKLMEDKDNRRTTIVIAHRLSTVRNADKIIVLGSPEGTSIATTGSIVLEEGSHDELMKKEKGFYKALVGAGERSKSSDENTKLSVSMELTEEETPKTNDFEVNENDAVEELGFWEKRGKAKKKDAAALKKEKEEKSKLKANKSRVWKYTRPEMPYVIFGCIASICKGTLFPLLSLAFSEMIIVWFNSDTDIIRRQSYLWSLMFYGLAIIFFVTEFLQKYLFELVGERLTKRLRSDTFRAMLRQDITWFENEENSIGNLSSRLSTDVKLVRLVSGQSAAATLETLSALTTGILISVTASWEMFLVMLAMVPLLGITEVLNMAALTASEGKIRGEMTKNSGVLLETVNGIKEVQAFSLETMIAGEIRTSLFDTVGPASRKAAILKGFTMGMIQLIMFGVYALAFYVGGELIDKGRIDFGEFNKALWAMAFAASGLGQAAIFAGDAVKAKAAVKAIFDTIDHVSAIDSQPWENKGLADHKTQIPTVRTLPEGNITNGGAILSKVNFAYPSRKAAKIFDDIDLEIPAGKVVALVGSSGSGKSTVIQMLERFYDPILYREEKDGMETKMVAHSGNCGQVQVDDVDMKDIDCRWVRKNMGLVGQEPVLFNDTVYNNIALGKENCTRQEVEEAARNANAYDFIMKLQDGFDTNVGASGGKVSGGQKQRIAIARALVGKPKFLLLDEATSALDNESEKIVQASLDALVQASAGNRTTIIIAHRLSTIRTADVICVFENNGNGSKVVEIGSHDELMQLGKKYKALVQAYET